ncbi:hypothetical protein FOZ62_007823, partial [Perkinsus olseni]
MATSFSSPRPVTPDSSGGMGLEVDDDHSESSWSSSAQPPNPSPRKIFWRIEADRGTIMHFCLQGTILHRPGGDAECQPGSFLSSKASAMDWADWLGEVTKEPSDHPEEEESVVALHVP